MLSLAHIKKSYNRKVILHDLSFSIKEQEFVCIIGPSGCGKSTLLKTIAGLYAPDSGTLHTQAKISMVFQNGALLPWRTAEQNVELGLHGESSKNIKTEKATAKKFLDMVGLSSFMNKYPRELSGGQRQRVGIARALAAAPSLLLLDEPFSALDPKTTHELHDDILRVWKDEKLTVLMVSHSIEEAVSLADRIILMKAGKIEEIFTINLPYPRREQGLAFHNLVLKIRAKFFE